LKRIDIRDVLFLGGIGTLGYGLYLKEPWIAFSVVGALFIIAGYLMGNKS